MRECGACTSCCTNTRVPELDKPERVPCAHCGEGCQIYTNRPASCEEFRCYWLKGNFPDRYRPDLSGVMVEDYGRFLFAMCDGDEWMAMREVLEPLAIPIVIGTRAGNHMLLPLGSNPYQVMQYVKEALG